MNTEKLITELRQIIADNTGLALNKVFTPDLPKEVVNGVAITLLGGDTTNNICNGIEYADISGRVLVRGSENDTETRKLCDEIFNALHLLYDYEFDYGKIINVVCQLPVFVGKDENNINVYNITFNLKLRGGNYGEFS